MPSNPFMTEVGIAEAQRRETESFADRYGRITGEHGRASNASRLDKELRGAAGASPMANMMGAAVSMAQSGALKGDIAADILGKDDAKRRAAFDSLQIQSGPGGFMTALAKHQVNSETATKFLSDQKTNKEHIKKFGIQDIVRGMQREETNDALQQHASNELIRQYRKSGSGGAESISKAYDTSAKLVNELSSIARSDPKLLNNKEELNKKLTEKLGNLPGGTDKLVESLQERIKTDPNLKKYGDLGGLMNMNKTGSDVGAEISNRDNQRLARIGELQKKMSNKDISEEEKTEAAAELKQQEKLGEISRNREVASGKGDGGQVGGAGTGGTKITGELTIKLDEGGRGQLEATTTGAAAGG